MKMNRRNLIASLSATLAALFTGQATADTVRPPTVSFVDLDDLKNNFLAVRSITSVEDLARGKFAVSPPFSILSGPLDMLYWPIIKSGRQTSHFDVLITSRKDEESLWVCAVPAKMGHNTIINMPEVIREAIDRFESKRRWFSVSVKGGCYPNSSDYYGGAVQDGSEG